MSDNSDLFTYIKEHKWEKVIDKTNNSENIDFDIKDDNNNSLLMYAIMYNKLDIVKLFVEKGARLDILDYDNRSILYIAIKLGYIDIVEYLLKINDKTIGVSIVDVKDKNKNIPLHYAILNKHVKATELLLKYNSNIYATDAYGNNALHLAIYSRSLNIFNAVLKLTSNVNKQTDIGETALHIACNLQIMEMITGLLNHPDININIADYDNQFTPLHYAINISNNDIISLLLKYNADPNVQDIYGNTSLHYCISDGNIQSFRLLIDSLVSNNKINANLWNIEGKTLLHMIFDINLSNITDWIDKIIEYSNVNIQDIDSMTTLHHLIQTGLWRRYIYALKKKKIDVSVLDKYDKRAIDYLEKNGDNSQKHKDDFIRIVEDI